jgi:hypothetical protein
MTTPRELSANEELALQQIEHLMGFIQGKKMADMPVFTDELELVFERLKRARALIGWE